MKQVTTELQIDKGLTLGHYISFVRSWEPLKEHEKLILATGRSMPQWQKIPINSSQALEWRKDVDREEQKRGKEPNREDFSSRSPRLSNLDLLGCTRIPHRYLRQALNSQNRQSKAFAFKMSLPPGPLKWWFSSLQGRLGLEEHKNVLTSQRSQRLCLYSKLPVNLQQSDICTWHPCKYWN